MRVTDRMTVNHTLYGLQQGRQRLGDAQTRVITGRRLLRASDDPADVERAMTLASELRMIQQQSTNLQSTRDWLSGTDVALDSFNDLLIKARSLTLNALNDTNSDQERQAIAAQMGGLVQNALAIANTQQGGNYLFGGHQVKTEPFALAGGAVVYHGDDAAIAHRVESGQTMTINITGREGANGGLLGALTLLNDLQQQVASNDKTAMQTFLVDIEKVTQDVYKAQSGTGARLQRTDTTLAQFQQRETDLKHLYSQLVDADMAQVIAEMTAEERAYEMSLATSARVLPRSLLDFLR